MPKIQIFRILFYVFGGKRERGGHLNKNDKIFLFVFCQRKKKNLEGFSRITVWNGEKKQHCF